MLLRAWQQHAQAWARIQSLRPQVDSLNLTSLALLPVGSSSSSGKLASERACLLASVSGPLSSSPTQNAWYIPRHGIARLRSSLAAFCLHIHGCWRTKQLDYHSLSRRRWHRRYACFRGSCRISIEHSNFSSKLSSRVSSSSDAKQTIPWTLVSIQTHWQLAPLAAAAAATTLTVNSSKGKSRLYSWWWWWWWC